MAEHEGPKVRLREGAGSPIPFPNTEVKREPAVLETSFAISETDTLMCIRPLVLEPVPNHSKRGGETVLQPFLPNVAYELLDSLGIIV